jgi:hypothetical protein
VAGVLDGDLVDEFPGLVAFDPFDQATADDHGLVRVVDRSEGQCDSWVAVEVSGLAGVGPGEEDDLLAAGRDPERDRVR